MSASNNMTLVGRLTRDIELKQTKSGINYCRFTVAWSHKSKDTEETLFLTCKAWRGTAEFLSKFFSKGKGLCVNGYLVTEQYEKDGVKKSETVMCVDNVDFLPKSSDGGAEPKNPDGAVVANDEELPF